MDPYRVGMLGECVVTVVSWDWDTGGGENWEAKKGAGVLGVERDFGTVG